MTTPHFFDPPSAPHVSGPLPGSRSAEFLARQAQRESNARTYPRHLPIAIAEASGSFVRDVDGNVFIDFLTGAGVLSLGHGHAELVRAVTDQLGRLAHGLDFPTPAKDAFTDAQLSMLTPGLRDRMKVHFCGPTGANAVDAALRLCKTATGRGEVIAFQGSFHGPGPSSRVTPWRTARSSPIASSSAPGARSVPTPSFTMGPPWGTAQCSRPTRSS